jgi:hypothetical protein
VSKLQYIADKLTERLAELGETVTSADQQSSLPGVMIAIGARAWVELRRAPLIVIVPVSSAITPPKGTRTVEAGGVSREVVATEVLRVELRIATPRGASDETSYLIQDRLVGNVITALARGPLAPTLGTDGAFGDLTYSEAQEASHLDHALVCVLPFAVALPVIQQPPASDLAALIPVQSDQTADTATISQVEAT